MRKRIIRKWVQCRCSRSRAVRALYKKPLVWVADQSQTRG